MASILFFLIFDEKEPRLCYVVKIFSSNKHLRDIKNTLRGAFHLLDNYRLNHLVAKLNKYDSDDDDLHSRSFSNDQSKIRRILKANGIVAKRWKLFIMHETNHSGRDDFGRSTSVPAFLRRAPVDLMKYPRMFAADNEQPIKRGSSLTQRHGVHELAEKNTVTITIEPADAKLEVPGGLVPLNLLSFDGPAEQATLLRHKASNNANDQVIKTEASDAPQAPVKSTHIKEESTEVVPTSHFQWANVKNEVHHDDRSSCFGEQRPKLSTRHSAC